MITGAIFVNIVIIITITAVFVLIGVLLFKKLRENESLKYEFVTIIAHKFRTPLTSIKWSTDNLLASEEDSYKKQTLTDIHDSNESLIKLTGTLVDLTNAATNGDADYKYERVNLCDFAHQAMENAKDLFHTKNLFMSMTCSQPEIYVSVDVSRFEFVISTILENACAYSTPGRNISVTISLDHNRAAFSVTDNGIGIDPHDMPNIFTKFYRTKQAQAMDTEGLGIALFLAKSIVKRHKGKIYAFSEGLNKGSTFSVVLPRVK